MSRRRSRSALVALTVGTAVLAGAISAKRVAHAGGAEPGAPSSAAASCGPIAIEPASLRIAAGDVADLRAVASRDDVRFAIAGDDGGASFESAGSHAVLHAGRVARFDVVARQLGCPGEVRAHADVVAPLAFDPSVVRVAPNGTLRLVAAGGAGAPRYRMLSAADGAALTADGVFRAPGHEGRWRLAVTDSADAREVPLLVEVRRLERLASRTPVIALDDGASARVEWTGGSNVVDVTADPSVRLERDDAGRAWVALVRGAREGHVTLADRVTGERATTRLVAGTALFSPLASPRPGLARSTLVSGDFNGDGRPDLAVGHTERDRAGIAAGGVLVFYGRPDDSMGPDPDLAIEGAHPGDAFGSVLVVADLNADGIDDLVAGAPQADLAGIDRGVVTVRLGSRAGLAVDPVVTLAGDEVNALFGIALAARDLDGDGAIDLVVSAKRARSSLLPSCALGRAYVYRGVQGSASVLDTVPSDTVEIADAATPGSADAPMCPAHGDGGAVALTDLDGDGALDLAFGAPELSYPGGADNSGAIEVYRGNGRAELEHVPAWSIHLAASRAAGGLSLGAMLDAFDQGSAGTLIAGGRWRNHGGVIFAFDRRSFPAVKRASGDAKVAGVVITTDRAVASYPEPDARNLAWDEAFVDLDGDLRPELVTLDLLLNEAKVDAIHLGSGAGATPFASATVGEPDFRAAGLAPLRTSEGVRGLAVLVGEGGKLGVKIARGSPESLVAKLASARVAIPLSTSPADLREGAQVALARLGRGGDPRAFVEGAGSGAVDATLGRIDAYAVDGASRPLVTDVAPADAREGDSTFVPIDFDGDGALELAVLARGDALPRAQRDDAERCLPDRDDVGGGAVIRIFGPVGDRMVERARVVPRRDPDESFTFGASMIAADVDGDRKEDLVLARDVPEAAAVRAARGRSFVPGKVVVACVSRDTLSGGTSPAGERLKVDTVAPRLVRLGDVDHDGCEDLAYVANVAATGLRLPFLAYGHDPSGQRCHGHREPLTVALVPSDYALPVGTAVGSIFTFAIDRSGRDFVSTAAGSGDVTGDGVFDLVVAHSAFRDAEGRGPALEVVSGAWLGALCPDHVCAGATRRVGDWTVAPLPNLAPSRALLRGPEGVSDFGARLALADVDGDGVTDVAASATGAREPGRFSGAVFVYRGARAGRPLEPLLRAYGGPREDARFGASIAIARDARGGALLLVGAPGASRGGVGHDLGEASLFHAGELR